MIATLSGTVAERIDDVVVLDVAGVDADGGTPGVDGGAAEVGGASAGGRRPGVPATVGRRRAACRRKPSSASCV